MKNGISFVFFIFFMPIVLFAHHRDTLDGPSKWRFSENKGQWESVVKYKSQIRGGAFFLESDRITFVIEDQTAIERLVHFKHISSYMPPTTPPIDNTIKAHAIQMQFLDANKNVSFSTENQFPDYENYYIGNIPEKWASGVKAYEAVTYKNLYSGINLKAYSDNHYFKYDFILAPHANANQIKISYYGAEGLLLSKGNLIVKTSITDIVEIKPYAYQIKNGKRTEIACNFEIKNNIIGYKLGDYDSNVELVIDPTLVFSTYSGSTADNWGYTATYDQNGNLYSGGSVFGTGYPTTIGAYQITYGSGSCDISITKFNTTGNALIFSTYLGGSGTEVPNSLVVNNNNELYVLGTTGSANYPTTTGCYDNTFNGGTSYTLTYVLQYTNGSDIAITKFAADGQTLLGSTFYGGTGNDGLNSVAVLKKNYADDVRGEIMVDNNSNVYVVSSTKSANLPVNAGSFQPVFGGGDQDGCIIKMNQNLTNLIWSSYLGGANSDACYSIQIDRENNIYVAGGTNSTNFPTTSGVVHPTYQGGVSDGFISKINENGTAIIASSYYGSSAYDQVYLTKTDKSSNVFLFGQTAATGNTFIQNALWNQPGGGQFLSKLTPNLQSIVWSTAFGTGNGGPDISPTALLVDYCNNIYMSGWGGPALNGFGGTSGLPITPGAFQTTTDNHDYYFIVVKDDASALEYATFFGGPTSHEHVDGGTSRFDKKGKIYQAVCAGCGSNDDFPTIPGVWSQTNNSYNCNMGVIKFDFDIPALIADFDMPSLVCAPYTVTFTNNSSTATVGSTLWNWNFGDGSASSSVQNPTHTYTQSGQYDVRLIVSNSTSCNLADTMIKTIIVLSNSRDTLSEKNLCAGDFVQIGIPPAGSGNITYSWQPPTNLSNATISNPIATPPTTTTYLLLISNSVCTDTLLQKVTVYNLQVDAGNNVTLCHGDTAHLTANASGGATQYIWSNNSSFNPVLNTNTALPNYNPIVSHTTTFYVKIKNNYCESIDSVTVNISEVNISAISPFTICYGDTITIGATNNLPSVPVTYQWTPISSIISGANSANAVVSPSDTITYIVTGINSSGCRDTATVLVNVIKIASPVSVSQVQCYGLCNGSIELNPNSGVAPYNYAWSHNSAVVTPIASGLCTGNYTSTITDQHGCKLIINQVITQPDSIHISFSDTARVVCNGLNNGMARVVVSGGTLPYQYHWVTGSTLDSISSLYAGTYTITVTDQNQCTKTGAITITDTSSFNAVASLIMPRCYLECNGQAAIIANAGVPPYQYLWNTGSINDTLFNLCSGIYNATVTESHGCIRNVFAEITQPNLLTISHSTITIPNCNGTCTGSIAVTAIGGTPPYSYVWSNGTSTDSINNNLCLGNYYVTITDAHGCTFDTTFEVLQPELLTATVTTTKVPCAEVCSGTADIVIAGGVSPYLINWDNGQQSLHATLLCLGSHTVTVTDHNNCSLTFNFSIADTSYFSVPVYAWASPDTIYESQIVQLDATVINGFTYNWTPPVSLSNAHIHNPTATPNSSTEYVIHVYDSFGCEKTDTVKIYVKEVLCSEPLIYVPNAFTPNIDQKNDKVYVRSEIISDLYFAIYDRWGEKVFETTDINKGWDGTFRGRKCDPAVYVYYLDATCITKEKYIKKGNITLIK